MKKRIDGKKIAKPKSDNKPEKSRSIYFVMMWNKKRKCHILSDFPLRSHPFFFYLFGELLLTQLIESEELAGQLHVVYEPTTGQFYPNDDLTVWDHHGHRAEVDLQVLRKLLPTCITWVLIRQEIKKGEEEF